MDGGMFTTTWEKVSRWKHRSNTVHPKIILCGNLKKEPTDIRSTEQMCCRKDDSAAECYLSYLMSCKYSRGSESDYQEFALMFWSLTMKKRKTIKRDGKQKVLQFNNARQRLSIDWDDSGRNKTRLIVFQNAVISKQRLNYERDGMPTLIVNTRLQSEIKPGFIKRHQAGTFWGVAFFFFSCYLSSWMGASQ